MEEILHQLIDNFSHYLQGSIHRQVVVWEFWTINSMSHQFSHFFLSKPSGHCNEFSHQLLQPTFRVATSDAMLGFFVPKNGSPIRHGIPYHPWDERSIHLHEWLIFMIFNVGKYTVRHLDPMGLRFVSGCDQWWLDLSSSQCRWLKVEYIIRSSFWWQVKRKHSPWNG